MQYQQRQKWKKRIFAVIAVIIALIMVLSLVSPVFAAATTEETAASAAADEETPETEVLDEEIGQTKFLSDFTMGFGGTYIVGEVAPFSGQITNLGADFKGELRIKTYLYSNDSRNFQTYALYAQPLELPQGASEQVSMQLGMGSVRKMVEVELVDQQENVVYRKNVPVEALAPETVTVAVLSSQQEQVQYLSELAALLPAERNEVFFLDGSSFPSDQVIMENFDALIIEDFDTSTLNAEQRQALENWVVSGGLLILGTGPHANRVLSGLSFLGDIRTAGSESLSAITDLSGEKISLPQPMQTAVLESENLRTVWADGETALASEVACGGGKALLYHFSLGLAPFSDLTDAAALVAESCLQWAESEFQAAEYVSTNYMDSYADRFPSMDGGGVWLIFGCIVVYMILVGPVMYVVLKKKGKQVVGWVWVPAAAFVFLGITLVCSLGSAYKDSMVNIVSVVKVEPGASQGRADIGITIKSPKKGDMVFAMEDDIHILPKMEDYYYFSGENGEQCEYRVEAGETNRITFYDLSTWQSSQLTARSVVDLGGAVQCQIRTEGSTTYCQVENDSAVDFVDAYVQIHGQYLDLGTLPAGESREVSLDTQSSKEANRSSMQLAVRGSEDTLTQQVAQGLITRQTAFRLNLEEDMLNMFTNYTDNMYFDSEQEVCSFYGFSDAPLLSGAKTVNGKGARETDLHLYYISFTEDLAEAESFSLPYVIGPQTTEIYGQGYDLYYDSWEGRSFLSPYDEEERDVTLQYQVDNDLRIDLFQFYLETQNYYSVSEKTEIYNLRTGKWETLTEDPYTNTADYVDGENTILIRLHLSGPDTVATPVMRMEGGGKRA